MIWRMKNHFLSIIFATAFALSFSPAQAQVPPVDELVQLKVLPGWRLANGNHMIGVELTLAEGWKTYWRNPGDAGIPPEFNLSRSKNLAGFATHWPTPNIYEDYGTMAIGYKDRVVFPIELSPRNESRAINLKGTLDLGVCAEVCIPVDLGFGIKLSASDDKVDPQISAALAKKPTRARNKFDCDVRPIKNGIMLETTLRQPKLGENEVLVLEVNGVDLWVASTELQRNGSRVTGKTKIINVAGNGVSFARDQVRLTLLSNNGAVESLGCAKG
ncbi:hypothetical protein RB2150_10389 [Rhodobacterales bacterium HTCC2150]|nr:hypothetical protein RB2150_10389 [Rhodobacterales bacterium HTCC2150] [Rhodobacteraceae bacterium HTCC2150]